MFSYASLTKNLNIANCTNHEVTLFNPQFLTEDRRNNTCFFIIKMILNLQKSNSSNLYIISINGGVKNE